MARKKAAKADKGVAVSDHVDEVKLENVEPEQSVEAPIAEVDVPEPVAEVVVLDSLPEVEAACALLSRVFERESAIGGPQGVQYRDISRQLGAFSPSCRSVER